MTTGVLSQILGINQSVLNNNGLKYESDNCLASVGIGTPLSYRPGLYFYVTNTKDIVMNAVRSRYTVLPANVQIPFGYSSVLSRYKSDLSGHELTTYVGFPESGDAIKDHFDDHVRYLSELCFYRYDIDISVVPRDLFMLEVKNNEYRDLVGNASVEIVKPSGERKTYQYPRDKLEVGGNSSFKMSLFTQSENIFSTNGKYQITLIVRSLEDNNKVLAEKTIIHSYGSHPDPQPCNGKELRGGIEGYDQWVSLGAESGSVRGEFEAYNIPDMLRIMDEDGHTLWGTFGFVSGKKSIAFNHNPEVNGELVRINVVAKYTGTEWKLNLGCPGE